MEKAQSCPCAATGFGRDEAVVSLAAHWAIHAGNAATRAGLGIVIVPLLRAVPVGVTPEKMISVGILNAVVIPVPSLHSPKAMVLLVPSRTSRMPRALPLIWKTPFGGPLVILPSYSIPAP